MTSHCTVKTFCERHGIAPRTFYRLLANGDIDIVKVGRRTLVPSDSEQRWCESLRVQHMDNMPSGASRGTVRHEKIDQ